MATCGERLFWSVRCAVRRAQPAPVPLALVDPITVLQCRGPCPHGPAAVRLFASVVFNTVFNAVAGNRRPRFQSCVPIDGRFTVFDRVFRNRKFITHTTFRRNPVTVSYPMYLTRSAQRFISTFLNDTTAQRTSLTRAHYRSIESFHSKLVWNPIDVFPNFFFFFLGLYCCYWIWPSFRQRRKPSSWWMRNPSWTGGKPPLSTRYIRDRSRITTVTGWAISKVRYYIVQVFVCESEHVLIRRRRCAHAFRQESKKKRIISKT